MNFFLKIFLKILIKDNQLCTGTAIEIMIVFKKILDGISIHIIIHIIFIRFVKGNVSCYKEGTVPTKGALCSFNGKAYDCTDG